MTHTELHDTAKALVAAGKGILAADESDATIQKRFDTIHLESTEELRRDYREILFTTPGVEEFISGVILFDETIRQSAADGTPFPALLAARGIMPGIKADIGQHRLALTGARRSPRAWTACATAWRSTGASAPASPSGAHLLDRRGLPSDYCIWANAHALARYAALCQEAGLVPIVEPEVLQDGTHTIERSYHVTSRVLDAVYTELFDQRVDVFGTLLKPNMVLRATSASDRAGVDEVADRTLECFYKHVPAGVPGIVFLSGGQSDEDATAHLNAMNASGPHPWELSFSYGRALQGRRSGHGTASGRTPRRRSGPTITGRSSTRPRAPARTPRRWRRLESMGNLTGSSTAEIDAPLDRVWASSRTSRARRSGRAGSSRCTRSIATARAGRFAARPRPTPRCGR